MVNAEENKLNSPNKISDQVRENLEKIKEARWKMYKKVSRSGWESIKKTKQYDHNEISNSKRILLVRVDDDQTQYLMVNIGLPTKSYLRGEQVKQLLHGSDMLIVKRKWFILKNILNTD